MIVSLFLHQYSPGTIGWTAIAAGVMGFAALCLAILNFIFGRRFAGPDDIVVGLTALLTAALGMLTFPQLHGYDAQLATTAFALALLGGFMAAFGSMLAATRATSWFLTQLYVAAGYALVGLWLLMFNRIAGSVGAISNTTEIIGTWAGAVMALGLAAVPGILAGSETEKAAPWLTRTLGRAGNLGSLFLFPLWCIMLGRALLRA